MLSVVATPIGNLGDITLRALETFKECDLVVCEDTRVTGKLLHHFEIKKQLFSFHAQSGRHKVDQVVEFLREGKKVVLATDAGTPGISDPGSILISAAIEAGFPVVPIPGASAFLTAMMASGFDMHEFAYLGFAPTKKGRETFFRGISNEEKTVVFYESPHRTLKTLEALVQFCPTRNIVVARELTKMFEEFYRGKAADALDYFTKKGIKGEFVIIVQRQLGTSKEAPTDS